MAKRYFTPQEFAKEIGVDRLTVLRWIREKKLFAMNTGSAKRPKYHITQADILRFEAISYENNGIQTEKES